MVMKIMLQGGKRDNDKMEDGKKWRCKNVISDCGYDDYGGGKVTKMKEWQREMKNG
jgi:hypothetical protein